MLRNPTFKINLQVRNSIDHDIYWSLAPTSYLEFCFGGE